MLDRLVGNESAKVTLRRLITDRRVPNSLLFVGENGVGKRQFALELARTFLCTDPAGGEACSICPACRRAEVFNFPKPDEKDAHRLVIRSGHLDLGTVIPYNRNILVDAIRDLEREANFRPYEAEARVFIVDDADKMNDAASNALLKTLEEPPMTSYIFLVTSRPDMLLPTIRSRCQTLRFAPVATGEIESFLIEERAYSHDEAKLAERLSRGSIGRAVSINVKRFSAIRQRMLDVLTTAVAASDIARLLKLSEENSDAKNKEDFDESLDVLESLIHDVWSVISRGERSRIINEDLLEELTAIAARAEPARLIEWVGDIETLRSNLIVNINKKVATDKLYATMAAG